MTRKIIRNIVECRICGAVLESKHRHDFVACKHIFTDGGTAYVRRGITGDGVTFEDMIDKSEYEDADTN